MHCITRNEHYCITFIEMMSNQETRSIMATSVHTDKKATVSNKKAKRKKTYEHKSTEIASTSATYQTMSTISISELDVDAPLCRWEVDDEAPRLGIQEVDDEVVALPLWESEGGGASLPFASLLGSSSLSLCSLSVKVSIPM